MSNGPIDSVTLDETPLADCRDRRHPDGVRDDKDHAPSSGSPRRGDRASWIGRPAIKSCGDMLATGSPLQK